MFIFGGTPSDENQQLSLALAPVVHFAQSFRNLVNQPAMKNN